MREALHNNPTVPPGLRGRVMLGFYIVLVGTGRLSEASGLLAESKELLEAAEDKEGLTIYYNLSGVQATESGEFQLAIQEYETALQYIQETGRDDLKAQILSNQGSAYLEVNDLEQARDRFIQALGMAEQLQVSPDIYWSSYQLARLAFDEQTFAEARSYLAKSYQHIEKLKTNWGAGICLPLLGCIEILDGDVARGVQLIGFASEARQVLGMRSDLEIEEEQSHHLRIASQKIGEDRVNRALEAGQKLEFSQAFELARAGI